MCLPGGGASGLCTLTSPGHEHMKDGLASPVRELNSPRMNSVLKPKCGLFNLNFSSHLSPKSILSASIQDTESVSVRKMNLESSRVELHKEDTFKAWV